MKILNIVLVKKSSKLKALDERKKKIVIPRKSVYELRIRAEDFALFFR
jgi:hypothetical protein